MFKFALKLAAAPAFLLAAMPAHSVELLSSNSLTVMAAQSPFVLNDVDLWYGRTISSQRLFKLIELGDPALLDPPTRSGPIGPTAAIMPEPMSWAMMIMGLAAVGGTIRLLHRRSDRTVSFV